MFEATRVWVRRTAIGRALARNAPKSIPLTEWSDLQARDYFTVHLGGADRPRTFLASEISEKSLIGYWWNDGVRVGYEASIPNRVLPCMTLLIRHYCREKEIVYRGATSFFLGQWFFWHWVVVASGRLQRWLYKRKILVRDEKYELLRNIYDGTLKDHTYSTSVEDYMTERYGENWGFHPSNQKLRNYYRLVLDALTESGDLRAANARYRLSPQALTTLANYEEDNRRHTDAVSQQRVLIGLTFALVLVVTCHGIFPPPLIRVRPNLRTDNEANEIHG